MVSRWLSSPGARALIAVTSLISEHGLEGPKASGAAAPELICPAACGIFPDQGSKLCLLLGRLILYH